MMSMMSARIRCLERRRQVWALQRADGLKTAGNGRCGGGQVAVGGRARGRRGLPEEGDAGDQVRCRMGCGGVVGVGEKGSKGSLAVVVGSGGTAMKDASDILSLGLRTRSGGGDMMRLSGEGCCLIREKVR